MAFKALHVTLTSYPAFSFQTSACLSPNLSYPGEPTKLVAFQDLGSCDMSPASKTSPGILQWSHLSQMSPLKVLALLKVIWHWAEIYQDSACTM